jgi:hypothetical protein
MPHTLTPYLITIRTAPTEPPWTSVEAPSARSFASGHHRERRRDRIDVEVSRSDEEAQMPIPQVTISCVSVDCSDPDSLGQWWQELLGGTLSVDSDGDVRLSTGIVPLLFLQVPEAKTVKNRVHLDLRVTDFDGAVERARELGATSATDVYDGDDWQVFRDPEGNEFCILRPAGQAGGP